MFQFAFDSDLTPIVPDFVFLVAAACLVASLVGLLLDLRCERRARPRGARPMTRTGPVVDEADEARAYEWLTSGSGQCPPRRTPNSD